MSRVYTNGEVCIVHDHDGKEYIIGVTIINNEISIQVEDVETCQDVGEMTLIF